MRALLLLFAFAAFSCKVPLSNNAGPDASGALAGTAWELRSVSLDGEDQRDVHPDLLWFSDSDAVSIQSCNSCGGSYSVNGSRITFGSLACTRRACSDHPELATMIGDEADYQLTDTELVLDSGRSTFRFAPTDPSERN
ncbi:MAG: META domain-containing protein [Rubricoccaceae bacterium]|nr:META domain-containing protein [Rubricoccaceae bacterium]